MKNILWLMITYEDQGSDKYFESPFWCSTYKNKLVGVFNVFFMLMPQYQIQWIKVE